MVGVDHYVGAPLHELPLLELVVRRGDEHDGDAAVFLTEPGAELLDVLPGLLLAVDHDAVRAGLDVGSGTVQGLIDGMARDEAFEPCDYHELLGDLRVLPGADLLAEVLLGAEGLLHLRAVEGVPLEAHLVLDYHGGYAVALEGADGEHEVLRLPAGVPVVDEGLGGALEDVGEVLHAGGQVHGLDVRLALAGGVGEARGPHPVEIVEAVLLLDLGVLHYEPGDAGVHLHDPDEGFGFDEPPQGHQPELGGGAELPAVGADDGGVDAVRVRDVHYAASPFPEYLRGLLPDPAEGAGDPVVPVDHVLGFESAEVVLPAPVVLRDDLGDTFDAAYDDLPLLVCEVRGVFAGYDGPVGEQADHHPSELGGLGDDVEIAGVDDVPHHRYVRNGLHDDQSHPGDWGHRIY